MSSVKKSKMKSAVKVTENWRRKRDKLRKKRHADTIRQLDKEQSIANGTMSPSSDEEPTEAPKRAKNSTKCSKISESAPSSNSNETRSRPTLTIAVPGSIIANAQSYELRTYVAGQIARAAATFCVDEVVVYDEQARITDDDLAAMSVLNEQPSRRNPNIFLARVLQYMETPQYLRKRLFPLSSDFRLVGLLNPLDCPHHLRADDLSVPYREAVIVDKPTTHSNTCYADVGFRQECLVDRSLQNGLRVTLRIRELEGLTDKQFPKKLHGTVVSPSEPVNELDTYWGYTVRIAKSISEVFTSTSHVGGYDCILGTSDKGEAIEKMHTEKAIGAKHLLIVFGGLAGIEAAVEADEKVSTNDASTLFDQYINVCERQGARTIRTEEAIPIALAALRVKLAAI